MCGVQMDQLQCVYGEISCSIFYLLVKQTVYEHTFYTIILYVWLWTEVDIVC